jgi:uncharacterized protein with HEPN domain
MKKDDSIYMEHIMSSLDKITSYISGHNQQSFLESDQTQDAVIRQLEVIGEATKRISKETSERNSDIPWSDMAGMRDKLIHDYIDVDLWVVWTTASNDVPELKALLEKLK